MAKKSKTKSLSKKPIDYKLAASVSERVRIETVRLISSNCYQSPAASSGKKRIDIKYTVKTQAERKSGYLFVLPEFKLEAFTAEDSEDQPSVFVEATFVLLYRAETLQGLTKKNFDSFGNSNGVYNAWPYWREFVQNTIARMGLPPLTIPVFRLVPMKQTKPPRRKRKTGKA